MAIELAAKIEKEKGGQVAVCSVHTLKPLDREGISRILSRYDRVIVVEEHSPLGGLGPQVKALAWETGGKCKINTFSLQDEFIHFYGKHDDLLKAHGLSVANICQVVFGME